MAGAVNLKRCRLLLLALALVSLGALAESSNLLIQLQPGGGYRIWHADGPSVLNDDDIMLLDSMAEPQGSAPVPTPLGAARARRTELGVIIELLEAKIDKILLVDRDACGHLKTWHAEGGLPLTDDQATDLVMSALPGGGPRLALDGERHAKSFITTIGIMVAVWNPRRSGR